ncbi:alpha/beta hydrolase [Helcococcus kunzii]|uniref:alpha/beta hydrolase fold domain-containing protein n=1 Tax=Helcococcus kunzii TaxID=40091 RepID=UPI001BAFBCD8|nr:alpha/beta hydrolase [Helcococcus kunzii]QUY64966.1 alpha/beta hydrolase [Helcococcus kunzii]
MPINFVKVEDYDKKIDIWENAAGNHSKSKLDDMQIKDGVNRFDATVSYAKAIIGTKYKDIQDLVDTFTYLHEIKGEYEKETYEDIPYIIPYLVDDARDSVIVLSGGGFAYKTIDGSTSGGKRVAERLNARGVNCFLLHYRSNPYKFPIPILDLQRSIRYIRKNATKFDINPSRISIMGFSSGGYIIASYINQYIGKDFFPENYREDDIDKIKDDIVSAAMIYAPLTFRYNVPMLHAVHPYEQVTDPEQREKLLKKLELKNNLNSENIPQFISYSDGDQTINYNGTEDYIQALQLNMGEVKVKFIDNQDHGYSDDLYIDDYVEWLKEQ